MNRKLIELQKDLEFKLKQLEATPEEIEHILHLHGQRICCLVQMEQEPDAKAAEEFINAYYNQEPWVTSIPYEVYAEKLIKEALKYYQAKRYPMQKIFYLTIVRPHEWRNKDEANI